MPGLPAGLAVFTPLPLRGIPQPPLRAAPLFRADPFLRARRARTRTVHPQLPLQLSEPQLQQPPQRTPQLPLRLEFRAQHSDLGVLCLNHGTQPRQQRTPLTGCTTLIGHKPQPCST
jgi:hypothetical protein